MAIRTTKQNSALWKFYEMLADELNEKGLDMKRVLKPEVDIPWTKQSVHDHIWIPILKAMYNKESTTEMTTGDLDRVLNVITRHLGEKFGLSIIFPSIEEIINQQRIYERNIQ